MAWSPDRTQLDPITVRAGPPAVLALVLFLCAYHGYVSTRGLAVPPDVDNLRDAGAVQAILDGNWFGDPVYGGEWRWYPPLFPVIGAIGAWFSGIPSLTFWLSVAPWFSLLTPVTFFLMNARMFAPPAAAVATLALVLLNGAVVAPSNAAGYTPWPLLPNLALPLFFSSVWLIAARRGSRRIADALLIGTGLGVTFLAHTIPAVLLSAIVAAVTLVEYGVKPRPVLWLAIVAATELAWGMPFLAPLIVRYHLHIANPASSHWTTGLLALTPDKVLAVAALNGPGVVAAIGAWILRRRAPIDRGTVIILGVWAGLCLIFLLRQYACAAITDQSAVCRVFVLPPHHYHFYLEAAWACLIGHVGWHAARQWIGAGPSAVASPRAAAVAALAAVCVIAGAAWFLYRPYDQRARAAAGTDGAEFDQAAYDWILGNVSPADVVVTDPDDGDPANFTVMAAARRLVAAWPLLSNPYVDWEARAARLRFYMDAVADTPGAERALCALSTEAGPKATAWFLLPRSRTVDQPRLERAFQSAFHTAYRVDARGCSGTNQTARGARDG